VASSLPETTTGRVVGERIDIALPHVVVQPRTADQGGSPGIGRHRPCVLAWLPR
jgi:hypothetical protein